jgi:hypothetical protein
MTSPRGKRMLKQYGKTFLNNLRLVQCKRESRSVLANQRVDMMSYGVYI